MDKMEGHMNSSYHSSSSFHRHQSKKRKLHSSRMDTDPDDESETCSSLRTNTPTEDSSKKQNHSEIEKRRRDKMNTFITELSGMVPMCSAMSRKLDKLTVLRMAVQHMKTLRGSRIHSYTEGHYKPSYVSDQELKNLILQSAEGFLFVVGCDRGRLLYVSESVFQVLKYTQTDLLGQSWFDILHPKDVAKVKEQLSSSDLSPRERLIDAKTMLPVKGNVPQKSNRLCPGARRSFFCRMKCKVPPQIKEESENGSFCHRKKKSSSSERTYTVVHCTGYLKSWAKVGIDDGEGEQDDACNLSCLVAIGRVLPAITPASVVSKQQVTFISRHTSEGKFTFVDQKATLVLGFLPQELLGTSMYEYFHSEDISVLAEAHKSALSSNESVSTPVYQFRTRSSAYIKIQSTWKAFRNPWTKDTEYLLATHTLDSCDTPTESSTPRPEAFPSQEFDFFSSGNASGGNRDIQRLISNQMEASKIGKLIADEISEPNRKLGDSPSSSSSPGDMALAVRAAAAAAANPTVSPEATFPSSTSSCVLLNDCQGDNNNATKEQQQQQQQPDGSKNSSSSSSMNHPQSLVLPDDSSQSNRRNEDEELDGYIVGDELLGSSPQQASSNDGNDEAAMAVIMSLLEADAGLGGPVDFTGLPWPLP